MKNKPYITTLVVVITFVFAQFFPRGIVFLLKISQKSYPEELLQIISYLTWLITIITALILLYGWKIKVIIDELGLGRNIFKGLSFAFLATIPMMVGYFFVSKTYNLSLLKILNLALLPGIMEELLFRGFTFGQLYKRAKWGFIPAVMISALFFSLGHLYQGHDIISTVAILILTFIGGGWFAWLYIEWDGNLWVPIGLHFFMNLWWMIFKMGDNALGGETANIFRILTIIITVLVTIHRGKRKGRMTIKKCNLLYQKVE